MTEVLFYCFAAVAIASAVIAISRKNAVASALWLVLMFFALAGTYVLLEAWFVAIIQILVYAGAIMVLFLFVIMLVDLRSEELEQMGAPRFRLLGLLASALFLAVAVVVVLHTRETFVAKPDLWDPTGELGIESGSAKGIGYYLFHRWVLAFEVTSVLLLGGILGAVILTKRRLT